MRLLVAGLLFAMVPALQAQDTTNVVPPTDSIIVIDPDAPATDTVLRGGPPQAVIDELIAFYNDSATTRLTGDVVLPAGSQFDGKLAVHRGALRIAGRVRGAIAVSNGTLYLLPGADVDGSILVVGGRLVRAVTATHRGSERVYWDAAPVQRGDDGSLMLRERRRTLAEIATARTSFQAGGVRTTLSLGTAGTYNRVEGLPVFLGPQVDYRASERTSLHADFRGLIRTESDGSGLRSDFGYNLRTEARLHGTPTLGFEARVYSAVVAIDEQPLSLSEVGWAAVLLQRDYRDYFERRGFSGGIYVEPTSRLRIELSARYDAEQSVRATDPWSLFRNSDRWRRNPLIDDGHYFTAGITAEIDTRDEREFPSRGWYVRARYEHGVSSDVAPVPLPSSVRPPPPVGGGFDFGRLSVDFRRYLRLTPEVRLHTRLRADGWVAGDRLPIQRRVSLGGPDLLPGYDFRAFNCSPPDFINPSLAALCDRSIAAQIEVRTRLRLNLGHRLPSHAEGRPGTFIGIEEADLVLLADGGKAWLAGDGPGQVAVDAIPVLREWKYDIGVGLDAGEIGAYIAKGLSEGEPVHFVVRLRRRF